jgi:hypothetical protein
MPVAVPLIAGAVSLGGAAIASRGADRQADAAQVMSRRRTTRFSGTFSTSNALTLPLGGPLVRRRCLRSIVGLGLAVSPLRLRACRTR